MTRPKQKKTAKRKFEIDEFRFLSRYKAATNARGSRRLSLGGGSPDYYLNLDRETLIQLSDYFRKNTSIYPGMIELALANYLGSHGPNFQPQTASKSVNRKIEKLMKEEMKSPEIRGLDNWVSLQYGWGRGILYHGDIGAVMVGKGPDAGKLQTISSMRIGSNRNTAVNGNDVKMGVEIDKVGRPTAYYIRKYAWRESTINRLKGVRCPAEDFLFTPHRPLLDMTRGEIPLVSSFRFIDQVEDILSSQAASWQIISRIALAITRRDGASWADSTGETDDDAESEDLTSRVTNLPGVTFFAGGPNDEVKSIDHKIPGLKFVENIVLYLRLIGMPLALPIEIVLNDWSKTNYTSGRGSLQQAYRRFLSLQDLHERTLNRPWAEWKIKRLVEQGLLPDRPDILNHAWVWPTFPWIDELKEAEAWHMKMNTGISTHADALGSVGRDRAEYLDQVDMEVREAIERANKIKNETGEEIDWRIFCGREPLGKTAQAAIEKSNREGKQPAGDKKNKERENDDE